MAKIYSDVEHTSKNPYMFGYNLKQSFRGMRKNGLFSFLNIFGFAAGFAVCMVLVLFAWKEYTVDRHFENHQQIYRLIDSRKNSTRMDCDIAGEMKEQFPGISLATPLKYMYMNNPIFVKRTEGEDFVLCTELISTTNDFFDIFSVEVLSKSSDRPFADPGSMVISESTAMKLFGKTDVVGKVLNIGNMMDLPVSAVVRDLPANSSLGADLYLNAENENFRMSQYCSGGICYNPMDVYVRVDSHAGIAGLEEMVNSNFPENKSETDSIWFQPLADIYLTTTIEHNENRAGSNGLILIFLAIALLILLLSVVNYVNFSLSRQLSALKQIGIRVTNGAGKTDIRHLYMTEVALSVFIAFFLALLMIQFLLPYAGIMLGTDLDIAWLFTPQLLTAFLGIIIAVIIVSSLGPATILSRFSVISLFGKGNRVIVKQSGKRILSIFQLTASIILLICLIAIQRQLNYVRTTDMGFDREQLLRLDLPGNFNAYDVLSEKIENAPYVTGSSYSHGAPGLIRVGMGDNRGEDDHFMMHCIYVDESFLETFGITLVKGREFLPSDTGIACYFNDAAFKRYGWEDLDNKKFNNFREGGLAVVGVVDNFHVASLHNLIEPVALIFADQYTSLNIRLMPGNVSQQMQGIREIWSEVAPDAPISYNFYDVYFDSLYRKEDRQGKAIAFFSLIALVITSLGLLGQIYQDTLARIKEIGIRKVNGAKIWEVMVLLNKDFIKWVGIACILAIPAGWYAMSRWLQNFAYSIELSWWIFALAGLIALAIALLTVSWQSWQAARRNPVEALRYE
jgi:putative ABC transport system permease protein